MGHLRLQCRACEGEGRRAVFYEPPHDVTHPHAGASRLEGGDVVRRAHRRARPSSTILQGEQRQRGVRVPRTRPGSPRRGPSRRHARVCDLMHLPSVRDHGAAWPAPENHVFSRPPGGACAMPNHGGFGEVIVKQKSAAATTHHSHHLTSDRGRRRTVFAMATPALLAATATGSAMHMSTNASAPVCGMKEPSDEIPTASSAPQAHKAAASAVRQPSSCGWGSRRVPRRRGARSLPARTAGSRSGSTAHRASKRPSDTSRGAGGAASTRRRNRRGCVHTNARTSSNRSQLANSQPAESYTT